MGSKEVVEEEILGLFETKKAKGRVIYRIFAGSVFVAICLVWIYRATEGFGGERKSIEKWGWIGLFCAEIWFSFYWILTQCLRWNPVYRSTFKDRLLTRYKKHELPKVDIFVCTADHEIEPPLMVINTVLSVMAYDYPSEKLSIYLSDDGGSIFTFYALFEASQFSKTWLPYCRKHGIEPRSPAAYFASLPKPIDDAHSSDLASVKKLYQEMQHRIETSTALNRIPDDFLAQHKGFSEWDKSYTSKYDHDTILQILIDGRNPEAKDIEGDQLPTLVYLAREKRPQHFHNYKAGAMNSLIRVSSEISNGPIILNVDCDMYSNNSQSILDALCFFMDERKTSHDIAFVQFPQIFENVTKNDIYGSSLRVFTEISSPWFLPFGYIVIVRYTYSLGEVLCSGGTILEWWNEQRMWLYKRTSSYLVAFFDTIIKILGFSDLKFAITTKVADEDVYRRYEKEIMDFGVDSPMFTILTSLALVNLFTFVVVLKRLLLVEVGGRIRVFERLGLQILLCLALVLINLPLYKAIFLRKDEGKMPNSVTMKAIFITLPVCALFLAFGALS